MGNQEYEALTKFLVGASCFVGGILRLEVGSSRLEVSQICKNSSIWKNLQPRTSNLQLLTSGILVGKSVIGIPCKPIYGRTFVV
jgi:hypothetical protein